MHAKVVATPAALALIAEIVAEHGPVMFHQGDFIVGDQDVLLGHIGTAPFYIGASQFETWKHTDLIIDVVPGRGGMFSLDNSREKRFLTRSTICAVEGRSADPREEALALS
ncbi:DUF779 domain-containing protein [Mesorhizobium sp.]|uniref:DUF779 domain-containing protein n=1 Tax=Mesorhizobium sp. TaxID=1871066 RepID=UPI000FE600E1|nr:DUF779 domain-containing protein [Mesorhizobium sp.]RWP16324.1 MAG: DUF779 domain-containing protein [Mesorhizobium sp.]RWQ26033.1 MAG: DUF779 domain-containing protein [Mesorhizobium sp.]